MLISVLSLANKPMKIFVFLYLYGNLDAKNRDTVHFLALNNNSKRKDIISYFIFIFYFHFHIFGNHILYNINKQFAKITLYIMEIIVLVRLDNSLLHADSDIIHASAILERRRR